MKFKVAHANSLQLYLWLHKLVLHTYGRPERHHHMLRVSHFRYLLSLLSLCFGNLGIFLAILCPSPKCISFVFVFRIN